MLRKFVVVVACLTGILMIVPPSSATDPGKAGRLAFYSGGGVRLIRPDGTGLRLLPCDGKPCQRHEYEQGHPAWSPDGTEIAVETFESIEVDDYGSDWHSGIDVMAPSGRQRRTIFTGETERSITGLSWSPTGDRIVFAYDGDLYTVTSDGSQVERLTDTYRYESSPDWSSTGRIAFERESQYATHLWAMDGDGSDVERLTFDGQNEGPSWSPDGNRLAWFRWTPRGYRIMTSRRPDGSGARTIGTGKHPAWSPTGRRIAFFDRHDLKTMRPDGTRTRSIRRFDGFPSSLDWQSL